MAAHSIQPESSALVEQLREEALERGRRLRYETLLDEEPECECQQSDADLFDARGCEYHNPRSRWNEALRAAEPTNGDFR